MDLIVLTALKQCEETLREATRVDLTVAGWETVQFDDDGRPAIDPGSVEEGEGPVWTGQAGTHPLVPLLRQAINALDFVASGTLHRRTKVCGRNNCRCADSPAARHGPYFEWSRRKDGRLVHSIISEADAILIERAIANRRKAQALLSAWEDETAAEILKR